MVVAGGVAKAAVGAASAAVALEAVASAEVVAGVAAGA
jgi:hypothetical protein